MSISNISSATSNSYNTSEIQSQKSKLEKSEQSQQTGNTSEATASQPKVVEQGASSENSSVTEVSAHGDTVEISEQGKMKAQTMVKPSKPAATDQSQANKTTSTEAAAVQSLSSEDSEATDDTTDTSDLSQYTEYELKQMLSKGTISAAQYNAEIKSREEGTSSSESVSNISQDVAAEQ